MGKIFYNGIKDSGFEPLVCIATRKCRIFYFFYGKHLFGFWVTWIIFTIYSETLRFLSYKAQSQYFSKGHILAVFKALYDNDK
jgi:hypothetical protein